MQISRRQIVKALALSPLLLTKMASLPSPCWIDGPSLDADSINIFLHGFFFMEFQDDVLIVASPRYDNHFFRYRNRGSKRLRRPKQYDDLRSKLVLGNEKKFPPDILNFSRKDIFNSGVFINPNGSYPFLMKLPLPKKIVPVRTGDNINLFTMTGKVAESIKKNCGSDRILSLITCLQYDISSNPGFKTRHYYAEHCAIPNDDEMKNMLLAAKTAFRPEFDLQISGLQCNLRPSPSDDDQKALRELRTLLGSPCLIRSTGCMPDMPVGVVQTANCPQFGINP